MPYNQSSGYGASLLSMVSSIIPVFGRIFVVLPTGDASQEIYQRVQEVVRPADGQVRFFNTVNEAYAAVTSNNNDVILVGGDGSHTLSAPIAWTKSRVHVIGMDSGGRLIQQGAKIQNNATDTEAYVIKVTGTRNTFRNIKFIQVSTEATALTTAQMGGEGNLYKNCSFTFGVVDNLDQTDAYEAVCGEDSGTFIECEFGQATLLTSAARAVMAIDQVTASQEMKDCRFIDCTWVIASSDADANHIRILANTDCKFVTIFRNPVMVCALVNSNSAAAIDDSVDSVSGLVEGNILFVNPASNATEFCTGVTDQMEVVGPATSAATGEAITPA